MQLGERIKQHDFLTVNNISYSFDMNCHVKDGLNQDEMLTKICETISETLKEQHVHFPTLTEKDYRVLLVSQEDKLYQYLGTACDTTYNFLVFKKMDEKSITVALFGPIGVQQCEILSNQIDNSLKELVVLTKFINEFTSSDDQEPNDEIVKNKYFDAFKTIEREIEAKKEILVNLTARIYSDDPEAKEKAYRLIGKINVSASTGKIVLKSITAVVFAELAEEIARKLVSKTVAKTVAKAATKTGAKSTGKAGLKAVPLMGLAVGAAFGAWRLWQGDMTGAGLEIASGAAACVPGGGTLTSLAIDACILAKDISQASDRNVENFEELNLQIKGIECELYTLSERYENALCEYKLIKEVVENSGFSIKTLKQWVEMFGAILDSFDGPIFNTQGSKVVKSVCEETFELL